MKLISLTCPSCNARLKVENDRKFTFCQYCGTQIYLDDEVKRSEHTYRKIDEAKIKELEYQERSEIREREEKKKKIQLAIKMIIIGSIVMFLSYLFSTIDPSEFSPFCYIAIAGMAVFFVGFITLLTELL